MTTALQKYKKENYYLKYFALQIIYNLDALFFVDYICYARMALVAVIFSNLSQYFV